MDTLTAIFNQTRTLYAASRIADMQDERIICNACMQLVSTQNGFYEKHHTLDGKLCPKSKVKVQ